MDPHQKKKPHPSNKNNGDLSLQGINSLQNFSFNRYHFEFTPDKSFVPHRYFPNTLRGAMGFMLRKKICAVNIKNCQNCSLYYSCIYAYLWESPVPEESTIMRKYNHSPHPFVFSYTPENHNSKYSFDLTLIGRGTGYLPYFVMTVEELGKNGITNQRIPFRLEKITDSSSRTAYVYQKTPLHTFTRTAKELIEPLPQKVRRIRLYLKTPLRLKQGGEITRKPDFSTIFRNLIRRIGLLSYFHCGQELNVDFKGLIEKSREVETISSHYRWQGFSRFSKRQEKEMLLMGVVGEAVFCGKLEIFLPFLRLGEFLHVGKNCTFGFGCYQMEILD